VVYDEVSVAVLKAKTITENILIQDKDEEEEKGRKIRKRRQWENIRETG
jgi:hypothetical protein